MLSTIAGTDGVSMLNVMLAKFQPVAQRDHFIQHDYLALTLTYEILHYILKYCIKAFLTNTSSLAALQLCPPHSSHPRHSWALAVRRGLQKYQLGHLESYHLHFNCPNFPCYSFLLQTIFCLPPFYPYINCFVIELLIFENFFFLFERFCLDLDFVIMEEVSIFMN